MYMGIRNQSNIKILRKNVATTAAQPVVVPVSTYSYSPKTLEMKYITKLQQMGNVVHPSDLLVLSQALPIAGEPHVLDWKKIGQQLDKWPGTRPELGLNLELEKFCTTDYDKLKNSLETFIDSRPVGQKDVFSSIHWVETGLDVTGCKFLEMALSVVQDGNSRGATARQLYRFTLNNHGGVDFKIRQTNGKNPGSRNKHNPMVYIDMKSKNLREGIGKPGNAKAGFLDAFLRTLLWTDGREKLNFPLTSSFRGSYVSPLAKIKP